MKMKKITRNGIMSDVHWLQELLLLKCSHHPKQYEDSIESLSKSKWQVFTEIEKIINMKLKKIVKS
jgi:hypothetical protein